jgi:putative RNA 2'-phosphotransferase
MQHRISKSLSYWLRHAPEAGNLTLDEKGWADLDDVGRALKGKGLDPALIADVVANNDKQRFEISPDGLFIRAKQGHSVEIDLDWPVQAPPDFLYHGTVERFLDAILVQGLKPMARHHVHLSADVETATKVGSRRGKPIILRVAAGKMVAQGSEFHLSSNGVWLVKHVSTEFIERF